MTPGFVLTKIVRSVSTFMIQLRQLHTDKFGTKKVKLQVEGTFDWSLLCFRYSTVCFHSKGVCVVHSAVKQAEKRCYSTGTTSYRYSPIPPV
jgi:hypothetical protein